VDSLVRAPLSAELRIAGIDSLVPVFLRTQTQGQPALVLMPVNPGNVQGGGDAQLVISNGSIVCPALAITIQPTPTVPGEFSRGLRAVDGMLRTLAQRLGGNPDSLIAAPLDSVPSHLLHVAAGLHALHGPSNPNAIDSAVAGTAPLLRGARLDMAAIEGVLAAAGYATAIERLAASIDGELSSRHLTPLPFGGFPAHSFGAQTVAPNVPAVGPRVILSCVDACPGATVSALILHRRMAVQEQIEAAVNSVNLEAISSSLAVLGAAAALTTGPGALVVGKVTFWAGWTIGVATLVGKLVAFSLPATLGPLDLEVDESVFNEDADSPSGYWRGKISATSTGGTIVWSDVLGALPGIGKLDEWRAGWRGVANAKWASETQGVLDLTQATVANAWGKSAPVDAYVVKPDITGPVRINPSTDAALFSWTLSGSAFGFSAPIPSQYTGKEAGTSTLTVRTTPPYFKRQARADSRELVIRPITVRIANSGLPPVAATEFVVQPGERLPLVALVENADDPCVEWSAPAGGTLLSSECIKGTSAPPTLFTAPTKPGTYLVNAESMSRTGPRKSGLPKRMGSANVIVSGFELLPRLQCMQVGKTEQFSVTDAGRAIPFSDLLVTVKGGTMSATGLFTATTIGEGSVTVRMKNPPNTEATVTFRIAQNCGQFSARVTGSRQVTVSRACGDISGRDPTATASPTITSLQFYSEEPYALFTLLVPQPLVTPPELGAEGTSQTIRGKFSGNVQLQGEGSPFFDQIEPGDADGVFVPLTVRWVRVPGRPGGVAAELSGSFSKQYWRFALPGIDSEPVGTRLQITADLEFTGIVLNSDSQSCSELP
jgi:hypothetical protein